MPSILSCFLITLSVTTFLPLVKNQHWIFRVADFYRIQILVLQCVVLPLALYFIVNNFSVYNKLICFLFLIAVAYQVFVLYPYLNAFKTKVNTQQKEIISVISVNVYQPNNNYQKLIDLIQKHNPNIFLTIESNSKWEKALSVFDTSYKYHQKIALDNTYGMHFYSNLKVTSIKTHFFVADDIPSIEAHITTKQGNSFILYGIHPPPASPTEEKTSKEKDGELMSVAKRTRIQNNSTLVLGDFNSVAWSRITKLFTKVSGLKDARIGRGFVSTFPSKFFLLRIPIDLVYHSNNVVISKLTTLEHIKSDHLPMYVEFFLTKETSITKTDLNKNTLEKTNKFISKGIQETSKNR